MQEPQRQRTVNVDAHLAQVPELPFDFSIGMRARSAGHDAVQPRQPRQVTTQGRPFHSRSLPHCPPAKGFIDVIDALNLSRPPAKDIS